MRTYRVARSLTIVAGIAAASVAMTAFQQPAAPAAAPFQFRAEQIASDFGIGYAVALGDVNGDQRTDIIAINATDLVAFNALLTKNNLQPIPAASPAIPMPACTLGGQTAGAAGRPSSAAGGRGNGRGQE